MSVNYGFTNKSVNFMGKSQIPKLLTENPKVVAEKVKSLAPKLSTEDSKVLTENIKNIAKALEVPVDTFVKVVKK